MRQSGNRDVRGPLSKNGPKYQDQLGLLTGRVLDLDATRGIALVRREACLAETRLP